MLQLILSVALLYTVVGAAALWYRRQNAEGINTHSTPNATSTGGD